MNTWRSIAVAATAVAAISVAEAFWVSGKYEARIDECMALKTQLEEANRTISALSAKPGKRDELVISIKDTSAKRTVSRMCRNFGNVKALPKGQKWKGQIGIDPQGHVIFDCEENGLRAAAINLLGYETKHKIKTIDAMIERYCESNKQEYKDFLAKGLGIGVKEEFSIRNRLSELLPLMVRFETGERLPERYTTLLQLAQR